MDQSVEQVRGGRRADSFRRSLLGRAAREALKPAARARYCGHLSEKADQPLQRHI